MTSKPRRPSVMESIALELASLSRLGEPERQGILAAVERFYLSSDLQSWRRVVRTSEADRIRRELDGLSATTAELLTRCNRYRAGTRIAAWESVRERALEVLGELNDYVTAELAAVKGAPRCRPAAGPLDDLVAEIAFVLARLGHRVTTGPTNILSRVLSCILPKPGIGITDVRGRVRRWRALEQDRSWGEDADRILLVRKSR